MVPPRVNSFMQLCPQSPLKAGLSWLWRCPLMPHLKASNSEATGVVSWSNDGHQEGAVGDVLLVELHGDLVVSCRRQSDVIPERPTHISHPPEAPPTWLLSNVGDAAGAVLVVVEGDLRPARSFHSDRQTPGTGLPRPDAELSW